MRTILPNILVGIVLSHEESVELEIDQCFDYSLAHVLESYKPRLGTAS